MATSPPQSLIPPASRRRSLVSDLCAGVTQAMGLWGCDARHPAGNQLAAATLKERVEAVADITVEF
jgi:hypothetical protein